MIKQLGRHDHIYRDGKKAWTKTHLAWLRTQRFEDPLSQLAFCQMLTHLDDINTQISGLDSELEKIAGQAPWASQVQALSAFRGISTLTALGLIAEIGYFNRFSSPRELFARLGIVPSEYSSGPSQHLGHITKTGNKHARRPLIEAARHYRHPPRHPASGPDSPRAWHAQVRLHQRYRDLSAAGKNLNVITTAIARELTGFLWAEITHKPAQTQTTGEKRAGHRPTLTSPKTTVSAGGWRPVLA